MLSLLTTGSGIIVPVSPRESLEEGNSKPRLILSDSSGCKLPGNGTNNLPGLLDALYASFEGLAPNREYSIHLVRSDGLEIERAAVVSNSLGKIPNFALWQDWQVKHDDRIIKIDAEFLNYDYSCILKSAGTPAPVLETPLPTVKKRWFIYSSDAAGNPQNTFLKGKESVYITGKNFFPNGDKKRAFSIYVVRERPGWRKGSRVADYTVRKYNIRLEKNEVDFTLKIWRSKYLQPGQYDIILTARRFGILGNDSLIDANDGVGFEVIDPTRPILEKKKPNIGRLTCQAPVLLVSGDHIETLPPMYKDYFAPVEEVWIALPSYNLGKKFIEARLYVIDHQKGTPFDNAHLQDVSGGYETVTLQYGASEFFYTRVWNKPAAPTGKTDRKTEKQYDIVVDLPPFGRYNKGRDIIDAGKRGGFFIPKHWVRLESVTFNHTGKTNSHDALNIVPDKGKTDPEWRSGEPAYPAAYVSRTRATVLAGFSTDGFIQANIKAYAVSGSMGDLKGSYILFDKLGKSEKYFQVSSSTPAGVGSYYQEWHWYLRGSETKDTDFKECGEIHIATTINKIYNVLDEPQYPWGVYKERAPWLRVLHIAAREAKGAGSAPAAAAAIARFLYKDSGASYTSDPHYEIGNHANTFALKNFLNHLPTGVGDVNCYDMAKALVCFGNALGCGLDLLDFKPEQPDEFLLGHIVPAGWESPGPSPRTFKNHAFAALGGRIFDASLKVDAHSRSIVPCYRSIWMINIPLGEYIDKLVKNGRVTLPEVVEFEIADEANIRENK